MQWYSEWNIPRNETTITPQCFSTVRYWNIKLLKKAVNQVLQMKMDMDEKIVGHCFLRTFQSTRKCEKGVKKKGLINHIF